MRLRRCLVPRGVLLVTALMLIADGGAALAQSAADIRGSAHQVAGEIAAQKSAGQFNAAAQQHAIDRLGKLALSFIDLSDRAANSGGEARERESLLGVYQAVSAPLEDIYEQHSGNLERMAKKIMDDDGDLEALYETPAWKEAQVVASQALYFLNWVRYYGARLHDGPKRKELLEKAQNGFSEFAVGDRRSELLVESLLGRGLCHLELGNTEFAVHDLQAVINDPQASAERKSKARFALLDAYARAGKLDDVLRLSDQILGTGGHAEDNLVRFLRIRTLLSAAKSAAGAEAAHYRQQAFNQMDQLRRAGGGWEEKVAALAETSIDNPEKWSNTANNPFARWELAKLLVQKGDYKQAMPLLQEYLKSTDTDARRHQGEAHYFLGLALFQAGQYQEAAEHLDAALKEPNPSYGADAAYVRFKALEAVMAKNPNTDVGTQYEQAVRAYVTHYPDHKSAFEAHFRLGELLQAQHKCTEAIPAFANVRGDSGFELRAQFATLQCRFELLQAEAEDHHAPAAQRTVTLNEIGTGLQQFDTQVVEYERRKTGGDQVPLAQMHAKTAVMKAVYATVASQPSDETVVSALADFEKKYPDQQDLLPQVARLRVTADQHLGRFADAEAEVKAHGPLLLASLGAPAIEELAVNFVRDGARRNGAGDPAANQAAQQVALRLYELVVGDSEGSNKTKLTLARLYEDTAQVDKSAALYSEVFKADPNSLTALRGLARTAEAQHRVPEALGYWQQMSKSVRPGDLPWYEGNYEVARLTAASGNNKQSCDLLEQMKPSMPGLSDADLRKKLDDLYQRACR
jgi:TolA-binding protein